MINLIKNIGLCVLLLFLCVMFITLAAILGIFISFAVERFPDAMTVLVCFSITLNFFLIYFTMTTQKAKEFL